MSEGPTPFITILSPLAGIPILFGLFFGLFGCAEIIAAAYGIDLASLFPSLPTDLNVGAPLILFGSAVFALVFMGKLFGFGPSNEDESEGQERSGEPFSRWQRWVIHFCLLLMLLALLTLPFWLELSYPEAFVVGGVLFAWFAYKKLSVAAH